MNQRVSPTRAAGSRVLTGPEKASLLMLTMGEERSAKILPKFTEEELGRLTQAMAKIGKVEAGLVENVLDDFGRKAAPPAPKPALPEPSTAATAPRAALGIWDKIARVSPDVLAGYLRNEHPQAVAVVMRKLPAEAAARVLGRLPEEFAGEVVARIVNADPIRREVLTHLEETLQEELGADLDQHGMASGPAHLKKIMAHMDRPVGPKFVKAVNATDKSAVRYVQPASFTFDVLARLEGQAVRKLLDGIAPVIVAAALKGADEAVREFIIGNMPPRAAKILRQEIERSGPIRLRAVDEAQQSILERAKALADRGDIDLPTGKPAAAGN